MEEIKWIDFGIDDEISRMTEQELLSHYRTTNEKKYLHEYIARLLLYKTEDRNIENILLSELSGKKIIDIIIEEKIMLDYYTCLTISEHPFLLEYFLLNGYTSVIENVRHNIYNIQVDGISLAEYLFKNDLINQYTIKSILDCPDLLKYIKQYHKEELITFLEPLYFLRSRNGKLLLDELIELDIDCVLGNVIEVTLIEEIIKRKQYRLLTNISRYASLYKLGGEETIFEILLDNNVECTDILSSLDRNDVINEEIIEILKNKKRYDILSTLDEKTLIAQSSKKEKTILEDLLEQGITPRLQSINNPMTLEILMRYDKYEMLSNCSETLLIEKIDSDKLLIEELLERNIQINTDPITYPELVYIIYTKGRKDLYKNISLLALTSYYDLTRTYLDVILEEKKQDPSIELKSIDPETSFIQLSQIYLAYIRQGYNMNLSEKELLTDEVGMTLLEYMIQFDKKTTLEKVITQEMLQNPIIEMMVKTINMADDLSTLSPVIDEAREEYLEEELRKYKKIQLDEESKKILDSLLELMNDGKTDKKALELLEAVYLPVLASNSEYKEEVIRLIEAKKNNPNLAIQMSDIGSYYCPPKQTVYLDSSVIGTLRHEMGHMLHDALVDGKRPEELDNLLIHLRLSSKFKQRAKEFAIYHTKLKSRLEDYVEEEYMHKYDESITQEKKDEIAAYIQATQESENMLRGIVPDYDQVTVDEFIEKDRKIRKGMMVDAIIRTKYGHLLAISDIFDAVYEGAYVEEQVLDEDGVTIPGKFGHGSDYYSRGQEWIFGEMIANYSLISKSPNSLEIIDMFKRYVGEELYLLIKKYYDENILHSKKYETAIIL